jgi:ribosomal protein L34E
LRREGGSDIMLPRFRSKSLRKIKGKGRKQPFRYVRKLGRPASCPRCGAKLALRRTGSKSERRPSRAFGGVLCPSCSFDVMKLVGKVKASHIKLEDIDMESRKFVRQMVRI